MLHSRLNTNANETNKFEQENHFTQKSNAQYTKEKKAQKKGAIPRMQLNSAFVVEVTKLMNLDDLARRISIKDHITVRGYRLA